MATAAGRLRRSWDKYWYAWAMVIPVTLVLGALVVIPLVRGIYLSFTDANERNVAATIGQLRLPDSFQVIGLRNYTDVLFGPSSKFWSVLARTGIWTFACTFLHYTLGLGLAVLLNRPLRGRAIYRVLLILPWAVPTFISAFAWKLILARDNGILNYALGGVGVGPLDWLGTDALALVSVIAVNVWVGVPFMMVAILGGLQSIPSELYEAAEVDGASSWQRFWHVTLPGLRTVSAAVILLGTIWSFNMFPIIFLMTGGGPGDATQILVTYAFVSAFEGVRDYALAATYGVLIVSILVVFSTFYRRALRASGEVW
ncbi:carbohydrate ABC transporter permease [Pendulispora albinea]|uniref:Sugar ABC transporter permease n=1 Tax=Pendulispora albinea TaxID=2741071 RepID=A0ABZ2M800_9BACT